MSKAKKKTRIIAKKESASSITIRQVIRDKNGVTWMTYLVQGWKEDGKWKRKQFKDRAKAERFAALKRVELENKGRKQQMVLSPLTEEQHAEAQQAFDLLGSTYQLKDAVDFFLRHHRSPDYSISVKDAGKAYIEDKERDGLRERSVAGIKSTIDYFVTSSGNPEVHEVTKQDIEKFLRGLRARDGKTKASRRTWELHRTLLNGFFSWCSEEDAISNRPFTFENPMTNVRRFTSRQVREEQSKTGIITTEPDDVRRLLTAAMRWREGKLLRAYVYLYFAGLRPQSELLPLSDLEGKLVNLKTGIITIPAHIAKTKYDRQVQISENLAAWLEVAPKPIIPPNFENLNRRFRKQFQLSRDETRHSFISFHVALHRSVGDAALQAGNSESIIRRHYLNQYPREEGEKFFQIVPNRQKKRAEFHPEPPADPRELLQVAG